MESNCLNVIIVLQKSIIITIIILSQNLCETFLSFISMKVFIKKVFKTFPNVFCYIVLYLCYKIIVKYKVFSLKLYHHPLKF